MTNIQQVPESTPNKTFSWVQTYSHWVDKLVPYLFIAPFLGAFVFLFVLPAGYAFVLSFHRYKGFGEARWVGLDNYINTIEYHVFWTQVGNVIFYWIAHVIPMMAIAFLLAVLINSKIVQFKRFFKPIIFIPRLVATVATALIFRSFFGTEYGILNNLLGTEIPWLGDLTLTRWVIVFMLIWHGVGYWFVIFLAGLTAINPEVDEAAVVDGANPRQRLRYVTIPLMRSVFLFAFVVDGIATLRLFAEPNILAGTTTGLAPNAVAPPLNLLITNIRSGRFGQASAVGWILFALIAAITFIQFRLLNEREGS